MLLPEAKKAIFYNANNLGEISLEDYPDFLNMPNVSVHSVNDRFHAKTSQATERLLQIQPSSSVQEDDRLFMLLTDVSQEETALRIDVISAKNPLGSVANIARINTKSPGATSDAQFAMVKHELMEGGAERYLFATISY